MPSLGASLSALTVTVLLFSPLSRAEAQVGPPGTTGGNSAGIARQEPVPAPVLVDAPRSRPGGGIAISRVTLPAHRKPPTLLAMWRRALGFRS